MTIRSFATFAVALSLAAGQAHAQAPAADAKPAPAQAPAQAPNQAAPAQPLIVAPAPATPAPAWPVIWKRGKDGKVEVLGGVLDAYALKANPAITQAKLDEMKPVIADWTADVNQMVIDNLDLLDRLETEKLVDNLDINDNDRLRVVSQIMAPFAAVGTLTQRLEAREAIPKDASILAQQSVNDYHQQMFEEFQNAGPLPERGKELAQAQIDSINNLSRFLYYMSNRDVRVQYHAMLRDGAKALDQIAPEAKPTDAQKSAFDAAAAKVKAASTDVDRIVAMKSLLRTVDFPQRQAMLKKAIELGAAGDIFSYPPVVPHPYAR